MITKRLTDHIKKITPCGLICEILPISEYSPDIAVAFDIKSTIAHFHTRFDEIYFVLDGSLTLELYDPSTDLITEQELLANELCVITKGIHHKVARASEKNRLCVISVPNFDVLDEYISDRI